MEDRITVHRLPTLFLESGEDVPIYNAAGYWLGYTRSVFRELNGLTQKSPFDVIDFAEYGQKGSGV